MGIWGGIAGGVAGFAVGGPAGAAAGYGVGSALGDQVGGDGNGSRISQAEKMYGQPDRNNYNVPGYQQGYDQYGRLAGGFAGRQAPQAGGSGYMGQQQALGSQLAREASGNGIGQRLIQQQAQGQADRGLQQQYGMAASARPGQGALAYRQAAMNAGAQNAQVGGQSSQAAGQYQLGAMNNYGQFLSGARGQDDQMSQFNTNARLQQLGLNDNAQLGALSQRLQLQQAQQQGGMNYENNRTQRYGVVAGQNTGSEQTAGALSGALKAYQTYNSGQGK